MSFGKFSNDGKEYIINRPDLPRSWFHYITNEQYGLTISQTANGCSTYPMREGTVINRNNLHDVLGRCFYVRDDENGKIWSLNWEPVRAEYQSFECRFGLGYAIIESVVDEIKGSIRCFVDPEDMIEWWTVSLANIGNKHRKLRIFSFIEWFLGNSMKAHDSVSWYTTASFDSKANAIIARVDDPDPNHPGWYQQAFMACDSKVDGYTCSRRSFLGNHGTYASPEVVLTGCSHNQSADCEDAIGCLEHPMSLSPGEIRKIEISIGINHFGNSKVDMLQKIYDQHSWGNKIEEKFEAVKRNWNSVTENLAIETPDPTFDRWVNIWAKYQLYQCYRWVGGNGSNNPLSGYRDVLQFVMGMTHLEAEAAKEKLLEALKYQYSSGRAPRAWSLKGNHDTRDYRDSPVWIIFALSSYIRESGDFSILDENVAFLDGEEASVIEHALRAMNALINDRGEHGLSHIGEGDWLDTLNRCGILGKGESVWLSMAVCLALKEMAKLFSFLNKDDKANEFLVYASEFATAINSTGWDGEWYRRAYDDNGSPIGSAQCDRGRIFLNAQSWAIISGVADMQRTSKALSAIETQLRTPYGYLMYTPDYSEFNENVGGLSILRMKHVVYLHANMFKIMADCLCGRGTAAYNTFKMIDPNNPSHPPEESLSEPYLLPNGYCSSFITNKRGKVAYSGFTGTVPWFFKYAVEGLFGLNTDYDGVHVDPCIPESWDSCQITKKIRGARYHLTIMNPDHVSKGVVKLIVDGKDVAGNSIPFFNDDSSHEIVCYLGNTKNHLLRSVKNAYVNV